jgi:hypothetical protein
MGGRQANAPVEAVKKSIGRRKRLPHRAGRKPGGSLKG